MRGQCSIARLLLFSVVLSYRLQCAETEKAIWAKTALPIGNCLEGVRHSIASPGGKAIVQLRCHPSEGDDPIPSLRVRTASGTWHDIELDEGARELLWAPDSRAFFINGSANAGFFVSVYLVSDDGVEKTTITRRVQIDMVKTFPPCKALDRDKETCREIERHPKFNVSGLAWVNGSAGIIVMAEVPCSSSYGGIMCQVQGYRVEVPGGAISKRMTARALKAQWQRSMAWNLSIPEAAAYGPPQRRAQAGSLAITVR